MQHPRRGQPRQHQRADRHEQRARHPARALHRDDAPGPQPRDRRSSRARPARTSRDVSNMTIWGNHSTDDVSRPLQREGRRQAGRRRRWTTSDWLENDFIPTVAKRGAAIIEARGASSAASAANAADRPRARLGRRDRRRRLGVDGRSLRRLLRRRGGTDLLVPGARTRTASGRSSRASTIDDFSRERIDATVDELKEERDAVKQLGLI